MSTTSRGVRHRCKRPQPPPAVFRPSNSHQQYHGCQKQHRSTSCRSAYHRQSAPPPTCPWLQVEIFQSARCACLQCGCARRARRAGARASRCAPCVHFLSVQLRMKVTLLPPFCPAPPTQLHLRQVSAWLVQSTLLEKIAFASRAPNACQCPCYV